MEGGVVFDLDHGAGRDGVVFGIEQKVVASKLW